jgi:molecular chaperone GrpE (heat shock protein)
MLGKLITQTAKRNTGLGALLEDIDGILGVLRKKPVGSGLFFSGLALCLAGLVVSLGDQLTAVQRFSGDFIVMSAGLGFSLMLAGTAAVLKPERLLYVYLASLGGLSPILLFAFSDSFYLEGWFYPAIIWASALFVFGVILLTVAFFEEMHVAAPKSRTSNLLLPRLRENLDQVITLSTNANSQLRLFQDEVENWGAEQWQKEKDSEDKYYSIVEELFLLLDHLNIQSHKQKSGELDWICQRARRILEDKGIEEIPVEKGDHFNGRYHKYLCHRQDKLGKDTVLEVVRKGYFIKGQTGQEDTVLRTAEVIISSGPIQETESEFLKEVKD